MGFFTALELDLAIKGAAGLIHAFLNDVGFLEGETFDGCGGPLISPSPPSLLVTGDVTVPAGRTWTVLSGVVLPVAPGAKVEALGTVRIESAAEASRIVQQGDGTKGIKIGGMVVIGNGGEVKLP